MRGVYRKFKRHFSAGTSGTQPRASELSRPAPALTQLVVSAGCRGPRATGRC